jgi:hypothetical protein
MGGARAGASNKRVSNVRAARSFALWRNHRGSCKTHDIRHPGERPWAAPTTKHEKSLLTHASGYTDSCRGAARCALLLSRFPTVLHFSYKSRGPQHIEKNGFRLPPIPVKLSAYDLK